ncbi:MAG: hypothetical protein Q8916_12575 [Bacteroidota bacterium]|nr:hypothetical protein [Bacteroidota bacterium]MDP4231228.1 hypothetical protein [Bacteroidota bacterium]
MPQELYQELLDRLARLRRRRESLRLRSGLLSGLSAVLIVAFIAVGIEAIFHLSILGRTILFFSALGIGIRGFLKFAAVPILEAIGVRPKVSDEYLAGAIGRHYAQVEDKLLNVFQLSRNLRTENTSALGSASFAGAAFNTTYSSVRDLDFNAILDGRPAKRSLLFFLFSSALVFGAFFGARSDMFGATERLVHFRTFYQKPAPFVFEVKPGDLKVLRGTAIKIITTTSGEQLSSILLRTREEGSGDFEKIEVRPSVDSSKGVWRFIYEFRAQRPIEYYAESRDIESEHFKISVIDRPIIRLLSVGVNPPAYTREKPAKLSENFGDISAVAGTRADYLITSSKDLLSARVVFTPRSNQPNDSTRTAPQPVQPNVYGLAVSGATASGSITFRESGAYHIELVDKDSIASEHPIEYTVSLTPDEMPSVALIEPDERAELPSTMRVPMVIKIHDDFGFSHLRIGYRLRASKYSPEEKEYRWLDVPVSNYATQDLDVPYIWNLTKLELAPQDEIGYILEVADNDVISGPKKTRTSEFSIRFPSVEEIFKRADEQANRAEENLKDIKQDAEELKKKVDAAVEEMRPPKTSDIAKKQQDFTSKKDVEQILKRQEELNNRVADVKKDLEQMTKQLDEQKAISPETMQKYMELQKLFEEIKSPELDMAMKKLEEAMKNVDTKQLQEAMKNFQLNEEQFKKSIERTANILKKIKMEQKVDELMKRSDQLAKDQEQTAQKQQDLASKNEKQNPEQKASDEKKQADAKSELDRMKQEAKDVASDMKKLPQNMQAPEEMKDAQEALNDPTMEQAMQDAQDAMKQGQNERASKRAQDASQKAKTARNKLSELKKKLAQNEKQRVMAEMKKLRDEMNRLSKAEEQLKKESSQAPPQSNVFRDFADDQADRKEELGNAASDMFQAAQRSTEFTSEMGKSLGEAFNSMQQALEAMTERDQPQSMQHTQKAMAALNKTAEEAQQALNSMAEANKGGKGKPGDGSCDNPGGTNPSDQADGNPTDGGGSAMQQFLRQIEKLAAQQQALNDQMQGKEGGPGGAAAQEAMRQQAQMAKMAAQQQAVQKSVKELADEQAASKNGNKQAQEDLKKIADDMQDVISQMREKGISPETIQRQERILSRLLEAQRSVNERDKDQSRESKPGEAMKHDAPRDLKLDSDDARRALRDEMLRSGSGGYSKDYQVLIRKYLEKLEK